MLKWVLRKTNIKKSLASSTNHSSSSSHTMMCLAYTGTDDIKPPPLFLVCLLHALLLFLIFGFCHTCELRRSPIVVVVVAQVGIVGVGCWVLFCFWCCWVLFGFVIVLLLLGVVLFCVWWVCVLIVVSGLGLVLLLMKKKRNPILSFLLSSLCSWH
jgi:hypothetical protein